MSIEKDITPTDVYVDPTQPRVSPGNRLGAPGKEQVALGSYAIVSTKRTGQNPSFMAHLHPEVTFVHIDGHLFLWVLKLLLEKLPKLQTIRLIPSMIDKVGEPHRNLLASRKVELISGHHNPDLAWDEGENRSSTYKRLQTFFKSLSPEKKALFDELTTHGFENALMASKYFCLNGETFMGQKQIGELFGLPAQWANTFVSREINAVVHYLDPTFKTSKDAKNRSKRMSEKIVRIRQVLAEDGKIQHTLGKYGIEKLPDRFRMVMLDRYTAVYEAKKSGRLDVLKDSDPRGLAIISLRYGFADGKYYTLEDLGNQFGGLTRERIRQIEEDALGVLGIEVD